MNKRIQKLLENLVGRVGIEPTARWLRGQTGQFFKVLVVVKVSPLSFKNCLLAEFLFSRWILFKSSVAMPFRTNLAQRGDFEPVSTVSHTTRTLSLPWY